MEEITQITPAQIEEELNELTPLTIIRTETVLSQLPIHNLAKKGSVNIHIIQKDSHGRVDLIWKVSPSRDYGEPRQLAYKLDTIVINRRIDDEGRPTPKIIRLGSLREVAQDLELGSDTAKVRKALLQNASAFITAKLTYRGKDDRQRRLETGFTRYSVIFTGEDLPDGHKADAVYLVLNDPYREVLNNAQIRPLDYDYLRQLPPAAQRFYEILSRKLFGAFKWKHPTATLTYSEYCTYSAQRRYFDRQPMQNQMNAIHREHKKFGYIASVSYAPTVDGDNKPDWMMTYTPGSKARAEYHAFTRSGRTIEIAPEASGQGSGAIAPALGTRRRPGPRQGRLRLASSSEDKAAEEGNTPIFAELVKRGIGAGKAREFLARPNPELLIDQLEWGDHLIANARSPIVNPPGFYIHLVSTGVTPPETFETSRRRKARELARAAHDRAVTLRYDRDEAHQNFRKAAVDQHIAQHLRPDDFTALVDAQVIREKQHSFYKNLPETTVREIAQRNIRLAIAKDLKLLTFEEFCAKLDRGETIGAS